MVGRVLEVESVAVEGVFCCCDTVVAEWTELEVCSERCAVL